MKNSVIKRILCAMLICVMLLPMFACGGNGGGSDVDATKTQVQLYNYQMGYGEEWAKSLIKNFEEAVKDVSFEEGKKGVQVHYNGGITSYTSSYLSTAPYDCFFQEGTDYYELRKELVDITDVVAGNSVTTYDGTIVSFGARTGLDILTKQQKDYLNYEDSYYAYPGYGSSYGIIYNRQLFENEQFYLVKTKDIHFKCEDGYDCVDKTDGPDGIPNTDDDGLPSTYDEFYALCRTIANYGHTPIIWPGMYIKQHVNYTMGTLIANTAGAENYITNFTFNGENTDIAKIDQNGNVQFKEDGSIEMMDTQQIDTTWEGANGLYHTASLYYGVDFLNTILANRNDWCSSFCFDGMKSHTATQLEFLESTTTNQYVAMLLDGAWWTREASDSAALVGVDLSTYNFGWMPMPYATSKIYNDKVAKGTKQVVTDCLEDFFFIKKGLTKGVETACKALLLYANTDDAIVDFTKNTGTIRAIDYSGISIPGFENLSPFSKSYINYAKNADTVYQYSDSEFFNLHTKDFELNNRYSAYVRGVLKNSVIEGLVEQLFTYQTSISTGEYVKEIYAYAKAQTFWTK